MSPPPLSKRSLPRAPASRNAAVPRDPSHERRFDDADQLRRRDVDDEGAGGATHTGSPPVTSVRSASTLRTAARARSRSSGLPPDGDGNTPAGVGLPDGHRGWRGGRHLDEHAHAAATPGRREAPEPVVHELGSMLGHAPHAGRCLPALVSPLAREADRREDVEATEPVPVILPGLPHLVDGADHEILDDEGALLRR